MGGAFEVTGRDFAGLIRYKRKSNKEGKAYLTIFACRLSRAVLLELLPNLRASQVGRIWGECVEDLLKLPSHRRKPKNRVLNLSGATCLLEKKRVIKREFIESLFVY